MKSNYFLVEEKTLSPYAIKSDKTLGRRYLEEPCVIRTPFQRDRDRILHSKAFRRLIHKTQVFIAPEGDHYRTRLTHTLEVSQISRTVGRALALNEDLIEAIALGHDLGHTPFGHAGETALAEIVKGGFKHNLQSLRVVDNIEGPDLEKGLNLTAEVRDGILNHTGPDKPFTLEGQIVKIADRMAYINHDIDDALRAGVIRENELPEKEIKILGNSVSSRINTMVLNLIENSSNKKEISPSPQMIEVINNLRKFMFAKVYIGSAAKGEEDKARRVLQDIFTYYQQHTSLIPASALPLVDRFGLERGLCDYIAGMTDRYVISLYGKIFVPRGWKG